MADDQQLLEDVRKIREYFPKMQKIILRIADKVAPVAKRPREEEQQDQEPELTTAAVAAVTTATTPAEPFVCQGCVWENRPCPGGEKSTIKDGIMVIQGDGPKKKRYTICRQCKLDHKKRSK